MVCSLLACGIDPKRCILYVQSDVKEHSELMWILSCVTPLAELNRMTQFKDKKGNHLGLYTYPVMMAADILLYKATHIPAGDDQMQHLELTRDIIKIYSSLFNADRFPRPKGMTFNDILSILENKTSLENDKFTGSKVLSLRNPEVKMSKSDPLSLSRINITDSADEISSKIKKAVTDSDIIITDGIEKRLGVYNLISIAASLSDRPIASILSDLDGKNMSKLKEYATQIVVDKIVPIGNNIKRYQNDIPYVENILQDGANKAREISQDTLKQVHKDIGLSVR